MRTLILPLILVLLMSFSVCTVTLVTSEGTLKLKNGEEIELGEVHNGALLIIKALRESEKGIKWDEIKVVESSLPLYWRAFNNYNIGENFLEVGIGIPVATEPGAYKLKLKLVDNETNYFETVAIGVVVKKGLLTASLKSIEQPIQGKPFKIKIEIVNDSIAQRTVQILNSITSQKKEITISPKTSYTADIEMVMEDYGRKEFYITLKSLKHTIYVPITIDVSPAVLEKFRPIKQSFGIFAINLLPIYLFFELICKCLI